MIDPFKRLEQVAYRIYGQNFGTSSGDKYESEHPFDSRNIHPAITKVSK